MKIKVIMLVLIIALVLSSTMNCFASSLSVNNVKDISNVKEGDVVNFPLRISGNTIVPFEQGPNWLYGGQRTCNELLMQVSQTAVISIIKLFFGPIGWGSIGGAAASVLFDAIKNRDKANITSIETCFYKVTGVSFEHNHIVELYADGEFVSSYDYTYYDYNQAHTHWR